MEHLYESAGGLPFANQIGDTLTDLFTATYKGRSRLQGASSAKLRLDAAFVNALYNGLTEAILAVQFGTRRIVHWNKGAEAMFGYTAREVLGKTTEIIYPDQYSFERISQLATARIREKGAWQTEWEYRRRDGSHFHADVVATMIEGSKGSQFYVIVIRDTSARKRAEAAFKEQSAFLLKIRQRLQAVLDNTTMLIYVTRDDGTFALVNKRFETLFDANATGVVGRPVHAVFNKETADALIENNAKVLAAKTTLEFEEVIPQADGPHIYISVKVPLYDERGGLYAVCGISTDITECKRDQQIIQKMNEELEDRVLGRTAELEAMNEQLRQEIGNRRQAENKLLQSERMATLGVTTAKLVHEIANPLQAMLSAVGMLEQCLIEKDKIPLDMCNSMVRDLRVGINLLVKLLEEFRDLARPREIQIQPVNLTLLVREVLTLEIPHYSRLGIRIQKNFPTRLPLIAGDAVKLKQVLLNLLRNATEAMPQGGVVELRAYRKTTELVLEVSDTGVGIPDGINVFELFKSGKPMGTGLGLAIVRDIVSAHQGTISYTSQVKKGTTFQLRLPLLRTSRDEGK